MGSVGFLDALPGEAEMRRGEGNRQDRWTDLRRHFRIDVGWLC
jgi:hypothetical protein